MSICSRRFLLFANAGFAGCLMLPAGDAAVAQTVLPRIDVAAPSQVAPKRAAAKQAKRTAPAPPPARAAPAPALAPEQAVADKNRTFDTARGNILPQGGATASNIDRAALQALPQGTNTPFDKVLLQLPGVTQDSAAGGAIHVRNEHGNVQYRINGIMLPEGIGGLGQVMETSFIGSVTLLTGALPAQYGWRTSGIVDITTNRPDPKGEGSVEIYGGSRQTFTPSVQYGGVIGQTEYFAVARGLTNNLGIENPAPTLNAIHDVTHQQKFFGYASTLLDEATRFTVITGAAVSKFQIPNNPGQTPAFCSDPSVCATVVPGFDAGNTFNSANLNENQVERTYYSVAAVQRHTADTDMQVAYFARYTSVHFAPDVIGDLTFNGVAADVYRSSLLNGIQSDMAYRANDAHTIRFGTYTSAERTLAASTSWAFQVDPATGSPFDVTAVPPATIFDSISKTGYLVGAYVSDEWRLNSMLTLNLGLRFDQMYQFVDANQLSPRASLVFKPWDGTTFHAGYARTFTPPPQVIAGPANFAAFNNTTNASAADPAVQNLNDPVLPERANVYDVGVVQRLAPGLDVGVSVYHKEAKDLLDDGQFGAALVLTGFNYEKGRNDGIEFTARYHNGNLRAYANIAYARQQGTNIVSNQGLFGQDELDYIRAHWIYTDHAQILTASGGVSYLWDGTRFSADLIYGSGLRAGFANTDHMPPYAQVNVGVSREVRIPDWKPITLRFDIVNLFDTVYEIRDGSGIGVFAPQWGPRRAYLVGIAQKL